MRVGRARHHRRPLLALNARPVTLLVPTVLEGTEDAPDRSWMAPTKVRNRSQAEISGLAVPLNLPTSP